MGCKIVHSISIIKNMGGITSRDQARLTLKIVSTKYEEQYKQYKN